MVRFDFGWCSAPDVHVRKNIFKLGLSSFPVQHTSIAYATLEPGN